MSLSAGKRIHTWKATKGSARPAATSPSASDGRGWRKAEGFNAPFVTLTAHHTFRSDIADS